MKMKSDYTLYNQSSIQNYSSIDNVDQAVEYLKDRLISALSDKV